MNAFYSSCLILSFALTANATPASLLTSVSCLGENGTHFSADSLKKTVELSLPPEYPNLSSSRFDSPPDVGLMTWTEGRLFGYGGPATSIDGSRFVLATLLLTQTQMNDLPAQGAFSLYVADLHGNTARAQLNCKLQFADVEEGTP